MAYRVQDDVHVVVEITDLYYKILNKEALEKKPSLLSQFGIDEESFEKKELKPIKKYIETFKLKAPYIKDESIKVYFKEMDETLNGRCLAHILLESKDIDEIEEYQEEIKGLSEAKARERIAKNICKEFEDTGDSLSYQLLIDSKERVSYLENQPINLETKWHIVLILEKPKEYLFKLIQVIVESKEAYVAASKHIVKLKEKFIGELKKKVEENPCYMKEIIGIGLEEYPMKLYPMIVAYGAGRLRMYIDEDEVGCEEKDGIAFLGCYFEYISEVSKRSNTEKMEIINVMKLLGESSKFEIMQLLKKRPMYGIELAEKLGITPPTVSHHMNNLVVYKLVRFEKIDGKFYYVLNQEKIEQIVGEIKKQLVD